MSMQPICNLIATFANSFDLKDWSGLTSLLANPVVCDYRDLRGTIDTFTPEAYVAKRIEALQSLKSSVSVLSVTSAWVSIKLLRMVMRVTRLIRYTVYCYQFVLTRQVNQHLGQSHQRSNLCKKLMLIQRQIITE